MNVENIRKLAERLRRPDAQEHFDLDIFFAGVNINFLTRSEALHACGTVACIAGWAAVLAKPNIRVGPIEVFAEAAEWLELAGDQAQTLFIPDGVFYEKVTASIAAQVLDNLADTGEVVWPEEVCGKESDYEESESYYEEYPDD